MPQAIPDPEAAYPLTGITDPAIREAFRVVFSLLGTLQGRGRAVPELRRGLDAKGAAITGVATPTAPSDAVNLAYITENLSPDAIRRMLSSGGVAPLNIQNLPGLPAMVSEGVIFKGTHADRLAIDPTTKKEGYSFWETDRAALYQVQDLAGTLTWVLLLCRPLRTSTTKPADLGTNDAGFTWFDQVDGTMWRWSGGAWNYYFGNYLNTFANIPAAALADRAYLFFASDLGEQMWRKGATAFELVELGPHRVAWASLPTLGADDAGFKAQITDRGNHLYRWSGTAWVLQEGFGGPMRDVIANRPGGLGADDAGFFFFATDTNVTSRWSGAAWVNVVQGLASGGTNANLSATGGASQVLQQTAAGAAVTVGQLTTADISGITIGTYTPTLTNVANLDGSTAYECYYLRVGTLVLVGGRVDVDPTAAATLTTLGISLPIASNFGTFQQGNGVAAATTVAGESGTVYSDPVNDRAELNFVSASTADHGLRFLFLYPVI